MPMQPGQRAVVWCAGRLSGSYRASSEPRDDYLELQLGHGHFTGRRLNDASVPSQDVSIRYADRGRRPVVLRLTTAAQAARERDWVGELVELAQSRLPRLVIDPALATPSAADRADALDRDRSSDRPLPSANSAAPWWEAAANAIEQARLRDAEQLALRARAAGESDATEFLDTLRAIRRGLKVVHRWPRDAHAHLALAQAYFLADAGTSATSEAAETLRLDPSLGEAHALIGLESSYRGERERAAVAWERARLLAPSGEWQRTLGALLAESTHHEVPGSATLRRRGEGVWRRTVRQVLDRLGVRGLTIRNGPWTSGGSERV
ncbi:MAG: hypothetical protein JO023_28835, partial [Chloroflexi bacterium]|nr:hypothetical protein [Chloroflexota bacterium]